MRAVLDTNVLVSALLFERGRLVWLRKAWQAGRFTPLIDKPCVDELIRVLAYPKFQLSEPEVKSLLSDFLPYADHEVESSPEVDELPACSDPDDQKFLILAESGRADALVTGDQALLELAGRTRFAIETPVQFHRRLMTAPPDD